MMGSPSAVYTKVVLGRLSDGHLMLSRASTWISRNRLAEPFGRSNPCKLSELQGLGLVELIHTNSGVQRQLTETSNDDGRDKTWGHTYR